jgi:hypothetical protein
MCKCLWIGVLYEIAYRYAFEKLCYIYIAVRRIDKYDTSVILQYNDILTIYVRICSVFGTASAAQKLR